MASMLLPKLRQAMSIGAAAVLIAAGLIGGVAASRAEQAPAGNSGLSTAKMQTLDLGPEIEGMANRQLRFRMLTIEPGGYIGIHDHKDRPAAVYFLQGADTVTSGDGSVKVFNPGDVTMEGKDTTHWHRNNGNEPVVFVTVDILHKK